MIVDGRQIAEDIKANLKEKVSELANRPKLSLIQVGSDPASSKFVEQKRKFGEHIGVEMDIRNLPDDISDEALAFEIAALVKDLRVSGIVLQLPLPAQFDPQIFLDILTPDKDPDALSNAPKVLPPVAGAVAEILQRNGVEVKGKKAVVIGRGRLVGGPVAEWLAEQGAEVQILGRDTADIEPFTIEADIIVSGAGVPGLVAPDMIKDGAVLIDAGTSEAAGKLVGDIDPACASKALLYTPVPGGVGPITVAKLFENLIVLAEDKNKQ
jgi:methylenetetrahydrofolate dehydrogenase (NADP+)/methenyltetrahydrofolate cyclohydrolase